MELFIKTLLGVLLVVMAVKGSTFNEKRLQSIEECRKELNISEDWEVPSFGGIDRNIKCLLSCSFQKQGVLKLDGSFDFDQYRQMVRNELQGKLPENFIKHLLEVFDECPKEIDIDPNDLCETAGRFLECAATRKNPYKIKPVIDSEFKFSDIPSAYKRVTEGHLRGKVIVSH